MIKEEKIKQTNQDEKKPKQTEKEKKPIKIIQEEKPKQTEKEKKPEKKIKKKKKKKKEVKKISLARGKKKSSIARARIIKGTGKININKLNINSFNNKYIAALIKEPLQFIGPKVNEIDISINVIGGGVLGQALACRCAISNALIKYFEEDNLKKKMIEFDRSLVVEDSRRIEPKKYRRKGARARYQKSYR